MRLCGAGLSGLNRAFVCARLSLPLLCVCSPQGIALSLCSVAVPASACLNDLGNCSISLVNIRTTALAAVLP